MDGLTFLFHVPTLNRRCVSACVCAYVFVCVCVSTGRQFLYVIQRCINAFAPVFPFARHSCLRINPRKSSFFVRNAPRKTLSLCDTVTRYTWFIWAFVTTVTRTTPDIHPNPSFFSAIAEPIAKIEELAKIFPLLRLKCWNFSKIFDRFVNRRRESIRSRDFRFWGTKVTKKKKKKKRRDRKRKTISRSTVIVTILLSHSVSRFDRESRPRESQSERSIYFW